jgi:predicted peroxiredoxin
MTRKLLIVLVNTDPRNPEELGAPFYHAAVAAAMDYEVDVICAATAGKLMRKGVVEAICIKPGHDKTVYDWIRDAHKNGARFWACPANLDLFDMTEQDLIPECKGLMGAAAMLQNIMSDDYRVLTYEDRQWRWCRARTIRSTCTTIWTTRSGMSLCPTGRSRAGYPIAIELAGDVLVFTPEARRQNLRSAAVIRDHRMRQVGRRGRRFRRRRGRRQPRTGVAPEAAQRRRLRGRLDADRAARFSAGKTI